MAGPHRLKARKVIKLRGPQFPFNEKSVESDPRSQSSLLPAHRLSLTASQKRGETSRRLVSKEFKKLSVVEQTILTGWTDPHDPEDGSLGNTAFSATLDSELPVEIVDEVDDEDKGDSAGINILATTVLPRQVTCCTPLTLTECINYRSRYRSWAERTHNLSAAWDLLYEELADALLDYDASPQVNRDPPAQVSLDEGDGDEMETFTVEIVDMFVRQSSLALTHPQNEHRNVALVRAGFLASSATQPTAAISIRTLKEFLALRQRMPQFSVQAFTKVLCDLHFVPYKRYLRDQVSMALDVYFTILRIIDSRLLHELKRDGPDWRLKNACPPCTYKLDGEPRLVYSMMANGDGNMSLKRYARSGEADPRTFLSTHMLEPEEVDNYKIEGSAKSRSTSKRNQPEVELGDEASDESVSPSACAPRWKNARNENAKDTFDALDETGIFTVLCRHGVVLITADMIRTGERAKYPLATFSKVIRAHGSDILFGYDIGCQHSITARNHPLTSDLVRSNKTGYVVGSFHGYAHERPCQLNWHPLWRTGAGMEDFEGCERFFSHSNGVARCTQHATKYNRRQQIQQHIDISDKDVFASLGKFLYSNFQGAIGQLEESLACRNRVMDAFGIREEDFHTFVNAERDYLASLSPDIPHNNRAVEYITALESLGVLEKQLEKFLLAPAAALKNRDQRVDIDKAIAAERRSITSQLNLLYQELSRLEAELDVDTCWTNDCNEWKQAAVDRNNLELQRVVDNLERLCLERLLEMEKYLHGNTELISKSLSARSKALKAAVAKYNKLAQNFDPPRKQLTTKDVMEMTKLSDFKLLREYRQDVLSQRWALPEIREATTHALRVDRAREELLRVQIEARRLQTWIRDEIHHLSETLARLESQESNLAATLRNRIAYQHSVNKVNYSYIRRIETSPYFNGSPGCGSRLMGADCTGFTPESHVVEQHARPGYDTSDMEEGSDYDIEEEISDLTEGYDRIALASFN